MKKFFFRAFLVILSIGFLLAIWIGVDLYRPHKVNIRQFDANEIARLDTAMWRSYYAKERLKMFSQLTEVLEKQYQLPFWRRQLLAYYAAKAAFVFKDGKAREDYEKALPDLRKFYGEIRDISTTDFDVERVAKTELEWWIIHRERKKYQADALPNALAEAASAVYNLPKEKFLEYGQFRTDAMKIRDTKAEQGSVTEEDWQKIDELLHNSWQSLHKNVN
jgi:hypothetical protein